MTEIYPEIGVALPMIELLALIGALAVILIGIAVTLQLIPVEDAFGLVGRIALALLLLVVALCILKGFWIRVMVPWLSSTFEFLKTLMMWLLVTMSGLIVFSIVGRIALRRAGRYLTLRRDPQTGDDYEIHDSKNSQN